jgi:CheY-like chemotaxis protein
MCPSRLKDVLPMDGKFSVLVIDDDPATRQLLTAFLKREKVDVECVADGDEALARLEDRPYSVVLLDLMMPKLDGFGVIHRVSESMPHLLKKIIVVTAVSTQAVSKLEDQAVVWEILRKPFDLDDLLRSVNECARSHTKIPTLKPLRKPLEDLA